MTQCLRLREAAGLWRNRWSGVGRIVPDIVDRWGSGFRQAGRRQGFRVRVVQTDADNVVADVDTVAVAQSVRLVQAPVTAVDERAVARKIVKPEAAVVVADLAVLSRDHPIRVRQRPIEVLIAADINATPAGDPDRRRSAVRELGWFSIARVSVMASFVHMFARCRAAAASGLRVSVVLLAESNCPEASEEALAPLLDGDARRERSAQLLSPPSQSYGAEPGPAVGLAASCFHPTMPQQERAMKLGSFVILALRSATLRGGAPRPVP